MTPDAQFFVGQKAFIARGGEVLVLFHRGVGLTLPGGKLQVGEGIVPAIAREVLEETGLTVTVGDPFTVWLGAHATNHPTLAGKPIYLVGFRCEYVSGEVTLSDDFTHHEWVTAETYATLDDGTPYFAALKHYFETAPAPVSAAAQER